MLNNFDQMIDVRQWHNPPRRHERMRRCKSTLMKKRVFDLCDETFSTGHVGLWTKSDAVTYFDDLKLQMVR